MQIAKNTVVSLHYELFDSQGKQIEKTEKPIEYLHGGYDGICSLVEQALTGKNAMTANVGETVLIVHSQANRDSRPHLIGGHGECSWLPRDEAETEAESVAYVVGAHFGLDTGERTRSQVGHAHHSLRSGPRSHTPRTGRRICDVKTV